VKKGSTAVIIGSEWNQMVETKKKYINLVLVHGVIKLSKRYKFINLMEIKTIFEFILLTFYNLLYDKVHSIYTSICTPYRRLTIATIVRTIEYLLEMVRTTSNRNR